MDIRTPLSFTIHYLSGGHTSASEISTAVFFFCQLKLTLFTQKESHSLNEPLLYLHVVSLYSNSECVSVLTTVHCI